ncbi:MAG TPA: hypothetical protein DDW52_19125 [Planctomycetaceae bacterium]|nr:hypothetical protein [Planctomycetaceae bacterium]
MSNSTSALFTCTVCGEENESTSKFCSSCGQSLWEKCSQCGDEVRIGQKFCNGCGFHLLKETESKLSAAQDIVDRAVNAANEGRLNDAVRLLDPLLGNTDPRFATLVATSRELHAGYTEKRDHWTQQIEALRPELAELKERHDFSAIARRLDEVPIGLLDDELRELKEDAASSLSVSSAKKESLKKALAEKDWQTAAMDLVQLLGINPNSQKYQDLLKQVAAKLLKQAVRYRDAGKHAVALGLLECVPDDYLTSSHRELSDQLEELIFVRKLVARTRHLSPVVGVALSKLQKLTPGDKNVAALVERFSSVRKGRPDGMNRFHHWMDNETGQIESGLTPVGFPNEVAGSRPDVLLKNGSQFWVATGLALQGLSAGEPTAELVSDQKKGMLSMLSRKKKVDSDVAWGVDIGDSHIKLVQLKRQQDKIGVTSARMVKIAQGGSIKTLRKPEPSAILKALKEAFAEDDLKETVVVTSVANSDLLARQFVVPANAPKQHAAFIAQEAQANIPIAMDLLATAYTKFEPASESASSQNVLLTAVKRTEVESRRSFIEQLGASHVLVVPEAFGMLNLLRHCDYFGHLVDSNTGALLVMDVGFARSSVNLFSRSGGWFRALDWGIDDLSSALASALKITHADADNVRLNPASAASLTRAVRAQESAAIPARRELGRSLTSARDALGDFKLVASLLVGGGAGQSLLPSWINGEDI